MLIRWRLGTWQFSLEHQKPSLKGLLTRYQQLASGWDGSLKRLGYLKAYDRLAMQLAQELKTGELGWPMRMLDCGTGTGALPRSLLGQQALVENMEQVHLVDFSTKMLQQARDKISPLCPVQVFQQDLHHLNLPQKYHLITVAHALEHLENPSDFLARVYEQLLPGGHFLVVYSRKNVASAWLQVPWYLTRWHAHNLQAQVERCGFRQVAHLPLSGLFPRLFSQAQLFIKPIPSPSKPLQDR